MLSVSSHRPDGNLVDSMLSEKRDMAAAQAFLRDANTVAEQVPERVTTDGHDAYPRAIAIIPGNHYTMFTEPHFRSWENS